MDGYVFWVFEECVVIFSYILLRWIFSKLGENLLYNFFIIGDRLENGYIF